jgi:transposase
MNLHKNARLTPHGREWIVRLAQSGQTAQAIAAAVGVCPRTVRKWIARFRTEGLAGLADRSSRPHRLRHPTPAEVIERIEMLRRQRWTGKLIAKQTGVSPATVSRVLKRLGLSRMRDLQPREPIRRYEREYPGELIHLDIKKLGRFERVGHRITGDRTRQSSTRGRRQGQSWALAGNMPMSVSTMPRASSSVRSCPTKRKRAPSPSSRPPWLTTPPSASLSPAS